MRKKKILISLGWGLVLLLVLVLIALEAGSRLYRQKAADYFRQQFSRHSDMVLAPFQTSISVWRHFPRITFTFRRISFLDTTGAAPFRVLYVGHAEVAVPLTQLRPGQLKIGRVQLDSVLFHQKIDSTGKKSGLRFRKLVHPDSTSGELAFILPRLQITNARILTENQFKGSAIALQVRQADLSLQLKEQQLLLRGQLAGSIGHLSSGRLRLFQDQPLRARIDYLYLLHRKRGVFRHTTAQLNGSSIRVRGWHQARDAGPGARLNLTLSGQQPLMALFRELLPPQASPFLRRIRTDSRLHLVYRITGDSGPLQRPRNQLYFAVRNATFYLPASKKYIRRTNLRGIMDNGAQHGPQTSRFRIDHLSAGTGPDRFQLSLEVANFLRPSFALQGSGQLNLPAVAAFFTLPLAAVNQGTVSGAFRLRGSLPDTLGQARSRWRGQGELRLRNAVFRPLGLSATCRQVNARLTFRDSVLQMHNLSGTIGGQPFRMQASVRNYTAYIFNEPGFIVSQASIYARRLALHWLRPEAAARPGTTGRQAPTSAAGPAAKPGQGGQGLAPPWRNFQTQVKLVVDQLQVPGREQVRDLAVQVNQRGTQVTLTRMRFRTSRGGTATARGGFRLIPGGISRPYLDVYVHYAFLDLQAFMQNLAAMRPDGATASGNRRQQMEEYLEKRYWLNLHVKAQKLQYLYLQGTNLDLQASMNRQRAALSRLHLQALGGHLQARGEIQLADPGAHYPLRLRAQTSQIDLQQLFGVAQQMQLDLLSPRNIRGSADCQLAVLTRLDDTFSPSFDRTVAYARTTFRNMELIEVAPIQQALRLLRQERTRHLYFQDVHASFILKNNRFLTPGFALNSNLTDFSLSGTYTMGGDARLNMDVNVLSVLFGNNKRRIEKIRNDSTATDSLAASQAKGKQHLLVFREQNKYKVRLHSRQSRDEHARALRAAYSDLIRRHGIDTVFRMQ